MFFRHEGGFKITGVTLTWALAAVATGTGFYLVNQENDLSTKDKSYLIAAATLVAVALFVLTTVVTDYFVDMINFSEYHVHAMFLAWGLLVAATGIWWWVYNTRLVARDDAFLLTSAIASTIGVAFLTGSVLLEWEEKVPIVSQLEKKMRLGKKRSPGRPRKSPSRKSSPKRR